MSNAGLSWPIGLAAVFMLAIACVFLGLASHEMQRAKRVAIRYQFFSARDRLYEYAERGVLDAKSREFTQLRHMINTFLQEEENIGRPEIPMMLDLETIVPKAKETDETPRLRAIRDVCAQMASAFVSLMILNSRLVRIVIFLRRMTRKLGAIQSRLVSKQAAKTSENGQRVADIVDLMESIELKAKRKSDRPSVASAF